MYIRVHASSFTCVRIRVTLVTHTSADPLSATSPHTREPLAHFIQNPPSYTTVGVEYGALAATETWRTTKKGVSSADEKVCEGVARSAVEALKYAEGPEECFVGVNKGTCLTTKVRECGLADHVGEQDIIIGDKLDLVDHIGEKDTATEDGLDVVDHGNDEKYLSKQECAQIVGEWGQFIRDIDETVDEVETPLMSFKGGGGAFAEAVPIMMNSRSKDGNVILNPLFETNRDKLWMRDDHIINFVSCDGILTTPVGHELMDNALIKLSDLNDAKAELGTVSLLKHRKIAIFNLFIKETFNSKVYAKNIETAVVTLKGAMDSMELKTVSLSREGNGFDKMPWSVIESIFKTHFGKGGYVITVCTGEVTIRAPEIRLEIIRECHDSTVGGHKGETKTYARIRERYYWNGMRDEVRKYVHSCESCQRKKLVRIKTKFPMQITDTSSRTFEKVQMDLVGPLPTTESGNVYMLTWQDCLSKYSGAIPLKIIDASHIAVAFAENFICIFGCPETIQTDQGSQFMSRIMTAFATLFKIRQYRSSAYHPQSLGALERSHHTFVEYLRHYCEKSNWDQWLPFALFSFNTSVHESTGMTPHEIVFGRKVRFPSEFAEEKIPLTYVQFVDNLLNRMIETESLVVARLEAAKTRCKKYYDRKLNEQKFEPDQYVYLLVEARNKLEDHYEGPYKIIEVIKDVNLKIQISSRETRVVHVNRVKHAFLRYI